MEREAFTGHSAYLSKTSFFRFPNKGTLPMVPFMESLTEICPATTALLHSSMKVPGICPPLPHTRFTSDGKGPPWNFTHTTSCDGRQPAQCSLLFQFAASLSPCILLQCVTVNIRFFHIIFKDAGNI